MFQNATTDRSIFLAAIEIASPAERDAYVAQACGDDTQLRSEIQALLAAHGQSGDLLDAPDQVSPTNDQSFSARPGTAIGPYKLLQQIGEGGFGIVFMAEQTEPLRRKVALKVLKPGMDTQQVIARFEAERQALALMDHPNIARVLEAGTTKLGLPYFVMELVRGIPITDYCDQSQATPVERLKLFISVCRAVQHAHQKGIIHRDLKPSNVLVTLHDAAPVVKVIDFGIAKALGQQLTEKTLFTNFAQMMGTPLYMSPEQAALSGLDIDTRTDIYSLGVLLYELLTGTTPFEKERLRKADFDEMRRIIREEEPPKPSTRIGTLGQTASTVSANRQTPARRLSLLLGGELDWIVMKCLSKDRALRYESASALAADLGRYLSGQPIEARPPTTTYRLSKFARRNRVVLITTGLVAAALVLGTFISIWQAFRAIEAQGLTRSALFSEKQARQDAEAAQQRAELNFEKARQAVDRYYTLVSQSALLDEPGLQPLRKDLLEAALGYYQEFLAERAEDPRLKVELAATHIRAGKVCQLIDRNDEAIAHLKSGLRLVEELLGEGRYAAALERHLTGVHKAGRSLHGGTRPPSDPLDALRTLEHGSQIWERLVREHPHTIDFQSDLAGFYLLIGDLERTMGQRAAAVKHYEQATKILEKLVADHPQIADYRTDLATCHEILGQLGVLLGGDPHADNHFQQSLKLRQALATEFPQRPEYRLELASAHRMLAMQIYADQPEIVHQQLEQAKELLSRLVGEYPGIPLYEEQHARLYMSLAEHLRKAGQLEDAENASRKALAIFEKLAGQFPSSSHYRQQLVLYYRDVLPLLESSGRTSDAQQSYGRIIALQTSLARDFPSIPLYQEQLAWSLVTCPHAELHDPTLAIQAAAKAVDMQPTSSDYWMTLGAAHYRAGNWNEAAKALTKSVELPPGPKAYNQFFLAMTHWQLAHPHPDDSPRSPDSESSHKAQARQLYDRAILWMEKNQSKSEKLRLLRAEAEELMKPESASENPTELDP